MAVAIFGPTGDYPMGKLNPDDQGGIQIGITHDETGTVIINFGTEVKWIGMPPDIASQLAQHILYHAGYEVTSVKMREK